MCGITGFYSPAGESPAVPFLDAMNSALRHRGPDDGGAWVSPDRRVGLAMRRLSIIDVGGGRQPVFNEDGSVAIVFNGEIYNFQDLRRELEAKGHRFATRSDTETIVHLYEEEGVGCVRRLRGMFAFALWDARKSRLFLARDRFGKKPLFYTAKDGGLVWASELQALKADPSFDRTLDPVALDLYLSLQYIPSPRTIYQNVHKLPPGHILVAEGSGPPRVERYWDLPIDKVPLSLSLSDAKTELRRRLTEAVRLRMVSEVPLGAFLSGGVDSSVIVGLMSQMSEKPVKTFSIGFDREEFTELPHAREVARRFGTDHTEFVVTPAAASVLPMLAKHYGEPYADASALPTYYVARETRRHVTVALNGDGGDENFAGYLRHRAALAAWRARFVPGAVWRAGAGLIAGSADRRGVKGLLWRARRFMEAAVEPDPVARHLGFVCFFPESLKKDLYTPAFAARLRDNAALDYLRGPFDRAASLDFVNRTLYTDFSTYLPECLMTKVDIASMAVSLEARSPLLDHEFVEFVFRLPGAWKLKGWTGGKWIFKEAFKDLLPPSIARRGKMGFGVPLGPWFRSELRTLFAETVLSSEAMGRGYFRPEAVRALWEEHQSGRRDHGYKLWALLMLEMWHRHA
ncbi:MAG: asparagine synthase (glutamine-hydrolyzing) [Elusimicrobia bacterium]|nr:asparagine synthase (glutamine-hydrolyzing) [Elusimicrobiota bacterium]MBK9695701.1 asparagine synthase (glutamine-hydrolyzing) [Elusimicrobiota bacterium]MBK9922187.1 asparagine synthase (glutamine-hydrolyzing) [Elusimicrobiota bacterium]MBL0359980.1 asparagine synthase (glutamine-hydrolyzing) [Elusimicrobiota bacterium]